VLVEELPGRGGVGGEQHRHARLAQVVDVPCALGQRLDE
jgi:hypothetical protein